MIYSIWIGEATTLTLGDCAPMFADGREQDPGAKKIHQFEAVDWDEAMAEMDRFMGWKT